MRKSRPVPGTIEFYFDVGSPAAYLAHTQLPGVAAETGAELIYMPMLLGGVFQATGNSSPGAVPAKSRYFGIDLARFAKRYGVPFTLNPDFPINTLQLMRGVLVAQEDGFFETYTNAVFDAMWAAPCNMGEPEVVAGVLEKAGIDSGRLFERIGDPAIKERLKAETHAAVDRGVFGAPTCFVGDNMFFGQDRLDFVREFAASA